MSLGAIKRRKLRISSVIVTTYVSASAANRTRSRASALHERQVLTLKLHDTAMSAGFTLGGAMRVTTGRLQYKIEPMRHALQLYYHVTNFARHRDGMNRPCMVRNTLGVRRRHATHGHHN